MTYIYVLYYTGSRPGPADYSARPIYTCSAFRRPRAMSLCPLPARSRGEQRWSVNMLLFRLLPRTSPWWPSDGTPAGRPKKRDGRAPAGRTSAVGRAYGYRRRPANDGRSVHRSQEARRGQPPMSLAARPGAAVRIVRGPGAGGGRACARRARSRPTASPAPPARCPGCDLREGRNLAELDPTGASADRRRPAGEANRQRRADEAMLAGANLAGADLSGAHPAPTAKGPADLTRADLAGTSLRKAVLTAAQLPLRRSGRRRFQRSRP